MWHRQVVVAPCKMLFLTPETIHRSYAPESGWGGELIPATLSALILGVREDVPAYM